MRINVKEILSGWAGLVIEDADKEEKAKERAKICAACPDNKKEKFLTWIGDDLEEIKGAICGLCGCPLSPKVRSKNSKCPANKWP